MCSSFSIIRVTSHADNYLSSDAFLNSLPNDNMYVNSIINTLAIEINLSSSNKGHKYGMMSLCIYIYIGVNMDKEEINNHFEH